MNISAARGSKPLNPSAQEFRPVYSDDHSLFLTFSNGFPLTERQIFAFFNRIYAPYVEDVYVHKPRATGSAAKPSLFGKVIFKHHLIPDLVLGSREKVCFCVDGYPLYCRRFISQKTKSATPDGSDDQ